MSPEALFRRRLYLNCIVDKWLQDKLWALECERLAAENPRRNGRGRRTRVR